MNIRDDGEKNSSKMLKRIRSTESNKKKELEYGKRNYDVMNKNMKKYPKSTKKDANDGGKN